MILNITRGEVLLGLLVVTCAVTDHVIQANEPTGASYANPKLLIEPQELAKGGNFAVLDVREKTKYAQGLIPGALWVDVAEWGKAFGQGTDHREWSQRIAVLGIDADRTVVVYDDNRSKDAARVWWILRYWGVKDVRILNGGWIEWKNGEFRVQSVPSVSKALNFDAKAARERMVTKQQLLQALSQKSLQIIDARSNDEFCGNEKLNNKRGGAIPGAMHLEWSELVDATSHRFKPAADLTEIFRKAGINVKKPSATYCQSGGRASVMAFALELMGGDRVSNYYPSWAEWSDDPNSPIEKK